MDLLLFIVVLPELLILLLGFVLVFSSLAGNGDLERLLPEWRPRGKRVASNYWGHYNDSFGQSGQDTIGLFDKKRRGPGHPIATFALPKLIKEREPDHLGTDWNG